MGSPLRPHARLRGPYAAAAIAAIAGLSLYAAGDAGPLLAARPPVIANVDLSNAFATSAPWRLVATQGPPTEDPAGETAPGEITLCLSARPSDPCDAALRGDMRTGPMQDVFQRPHYLEAEKVLRPRGRRMLWVQTASLHSGDGDQVVRMQALIYRHDQNTFMRVYDHVTGHNNNQDIRYVENGPFTGDIISVDPTGDAPYRFWVVVNAPTLQGAYRQVLRYRSATRYNDGNPLSVIDSEKPAMEARLDLWKPGAPLPLPQDHACSRPHLVRMELWCESDVPSPAN